MYDEDGKVARRPAKIGLPVLRPPTSRTPCERCPKVPDDAPVKARAHAVEMTDQSRQCYAYYLECKAVGEFPPDPIVRRMAGLIRRVEDAFARNSVLGRLDALIQLMSVGGPRRG